MTPHSRRSPRTAARRSCFTLLELLVVIAVITILVGIVIGGVGIANRKAAEAKTRALLTQLEIAFDQYKQEYGYYPQWPQVSSAPQPIIVMLVKGRTVSSTRYHGLEQKNLSTATDPGRYFLDVTTLTFTSTADDGQLKDAFDNIVYYQCPGKMNAEGYDLWTAGADGKFGKPDATAPAPTTPSTSQDPAANNYDDLTNWKRN